MATVTGLITVNGKDIIEVDAVPSAGGGTSAPIGSMAMYDDGSVGYLYLKTGAANTAWSVIEVPDTGDWFLTGNTLVGTEKLGSLNDEDVKFYRNDEEVMRMVGDLTSNSGLLIGLSASLGGRLQLSPSNDGDDILKEVLSPSADPVIRVSRMHRILTVGAVTNTFELAIPSDYNAKVQSEVIAKQTGGAVGAVGDGASYMRTCHARNISGTVTMFKQQSDYTYEVVNQLDFDLSSNLGNIVGTVQGVTDRNISWGIYSQLLLITT